MLQLFHRRLSTTLHLFEIFIGTVGKTSHSSWRAEVTMPLKTTGTPCGGGNTVSLSKAILLLGEEAAAPLQQRQELPRRALGVCWCLQSLAQAKSRQRVENLGRPLAEVGAQRPPHSLKQLEPPRARRRPRYRVERRLWARKDQQARLPPPVTPAGTPTLTTPLEVAVVLVHPKRCTRLYTCRPRRKT